MSRLSNPLHSPAFYAGDPFPVYRELRATDPVCWNDEHEFWALLKYEDIRHVSTNPALFSSAKGVTVPDPGSVRWVVDACLARGWHYCPRLHIQLFGDTRGT